jgi:hypothetical protein
VTRVDWWLLTACITAGVVAVLVAREAPRMLRSLTVDGSQG